MTKPLAIALVVLAITLTHALPAFAQESASLYLPIIQTQNLNHALGGVSGVEVNDDNQSEEPRANVDAPVPGFLSTPSHEHPSPLAPPCKPSDASETGAGARPVCVAGPIFCIDSTARLYPIGAQVKLENDIWACVADDNDRNGWGDWKQGAVSHE